ncbi:MAG: alkaline phosphatase [Bacteroidia bacterium]
MRYLSSFFIALFCISTLAAQAPAKRPHPSLLAGPMVGYVEMREALLWVQTDGPATVQFLYKEANNPAARQMRTSEYLTNSVEAFTARLIANLVQPGKTYDYQLVINGQQVRLPYTAQFKTPVDWRYRTAPPTLNFALGSCNYINDAKYDRPGEPYGKDYGIFSSILAKRPDMMLWLGDNTYLREADWNSRTGIMYRYTHTRALPQMQPLLASVPQYAIWDDHDYGPNNSDRSYRDKDVTLEAFKLFWGNPTYGINGKPGTTSTFTQGDCQFFLMDNRYYRAPDNMVTQEGEILGEEQLNWLIESLKSSSANFKFVCIGGQVLSTAKKFENHINIAPEERERLLSAIAKEKIRNVIFLTGDRHHSELSVESRDGVRIYDFTVSPLTSGAYDPSKELNTNRIRGTGFGERAFGMVNVSGPEKRRQATLSLYDVNGKRVFEEVVTAQRY